MPQLTPDQIRNFEIRQSLRLLNGNVAGKTIDYNDIGFDIIVAWGASNSVGLGTGLVASRDFIDPNVLVLPTIGTDAGRIVIAQDPLSHREVVANAVGAWVTMGKEVERLLPAHRRILIMPLALSGAGFAENRWNPGNDLYTDTVTRVNAVLNQNPSNRILCFANFMHGGNDKDMTNANYRTAWLAFVNGMRSSIVRHPNLLFIIGGYPDSGLTIDGGTRGAKQTFMRDSLISELGNAVFVDTSGLAAEGDNIHFTADSHRTTGIRMANALISRLKAADDLANAPY